MAAARGRAAQAAGAAFAACDQCLHDALTGCSGLHLAGAFFYITTLAWWFSRLAAGL